MPEGWEQLTQHLTGTGDLAWLAWTIQQMTRYAANIKQTELVYVPARLGRTC